MSGLIRYILFIGDFVILNLSLLVSISLVLPEWSFQLNLGTVYLVGFSNLSWLFLVLVSSPYEVSKGLGVNKIIKGQFAFVFIHLLVTISLILFFEQPYPFALFVVIYSIFFSFYFLFRVLVLYVRNVISEELSYKNFVLIGRNEISEEIRRFYLLNPEKGYNFLGYVENDSVSSIFDHINTINEHAEIHEIFCCATEIAKDEFQQLVQFGLNSLIKVKLIVKPILGDTSIKWDISDRLSVIDLPVIPLDYPLNRFLKRCFDLSFGVLFVLAILTWLLPFVGLLIKLDSRGPVFFKQLRNGEGNIPFWCLKFRTMIMNSEADSRQATKDDQRITRIGRFLRKSSIDELPQFLNVLKGEMSLIGPRPHPVKLNEKFAKEIRNILSRHYVKPGITGLAQCLGYRGETKTLTDMENRVRLDRYYIENWSFWLDIRIIFLTVISLIRGSDKAY